MINPGAVLWNLAGWDTLARGGSDPLARASPEPLKLGDGWGQRL